jgi:hypothetical protein
MKYNQEGFFLPSIPSKRILLSGIFFFLLIYGILILLFNLAIIPFFLLKINECAIAFVDFGHFHKFNPDFMRLLKKVRCVSFFVLSFLQDQGIPFYYVQGSHFKDISFTYSISFLPLWVFSFSKTYIVGSSFFWYVTILGLDFGFVIEPYMSSFVFHCDIFPFYKRLSFATSPINFYYFDSLFSNSYQYECLIREISPHKFQRSYYCFGLIKKFIIIT